MKTSTHQGKLISFLVLAFYANGAVRSTLTIAKAFVENGFKVHLIVLKEEAVKTNWEKDILQWLPEGVEIIELNAEERGFGKILYLFALVRYLRKYKPVALISMLRTINFESIAKRLAGVQTKIIVTARTHLSSYLENSPPHVKNSVTGYLLKKHVGFYPWADSIVSVSHGVAEDIEKLAGRRLEHIRVIYNPVVRPELFEKAQQPIDHPWFAPGEPPVILGVGRYNIQKDFPTLIRAFTLVRQQLPARLMILGEGYEDERRGLEALIQELGLNEEVALPGWMMNPYAYMSQAGVFVLSSIYEGFGNVIVEALACGTPVVSTDCLSGPSEILEHGKYGKLVPMGDVAAMADEIVATLNNPPNPEVLQQHAAQNFSMEACVNRYLELVNSQPAMSSAR